MHPMATALDRAQRVNPTAVRDSLFTSTGNLTYNGIQFTSMLLIRIYDVCRIFLPICLVKVFCLRKGKINDLWRSGENFCQVRVYQASLKSTSSNPQRNSNSTHKFLSP